MGHFENVGTNGHTSQISKSIDDENEKENDSAEGLTRFKIGKEKFQPERVNLTD